MKTKGYIKLFFIMIEVGFLDIFQKVTFDYFCNSKGG